MTKTIKKESTKTKLKAKKFAKKYIENNMNGTKTIQDLDGIANKNYAHVKASRMIQKDTVKKELRELLEDSDELVHSVLKRNLEQDKNIPASNQAIDIVNKIKGTYAPTKSMTLNATLSKEERKQAIKELQAEYTQLQEGDTERYTQHPTNGVE